jgi:heme exporter protein A
MNGAAPALEVRGLTKNFDRRPILDDIDLTLERGEFLLLLGPNGAGKTTLLRVLATLLAPTSGDVSILGHKLKEEPTEIRRRIGFISHSHLLYRDLTTYENLRFYGEMYGVADLDDRIAELLERVELTHRRYDTVRNFSRGMFQRLAIARALLHRPELLFLDEPQTGLDPHAVDILDNIIEELRADHTFVMVTHNLERSLELGTKAVILKNGRKVYDSAKKPDPAELKATYRRVCITGDTDECD